ncbi:N-alpha-acetyl-L-2,4-diaminobutyrate deacetylase [Ketogulonicigenium robustum]|uniref:N-alpha-acetyl-L-2,4-diaminobutyrate deacetylase n=1 Tax=Ketogulonicigenium robustum TaxID=92947 RepID=A0A1W6NZN2_9RHOB|nr:succinylglutamate desuccinylase/aspartoacylase family protein [Ketogulonicigenium robustum]ARO14631.1 N-alpha-acetyl-L-2,4-diaminobutyrate deacetylase [Ketogulonicigenium robustum]
MVKAINRLTPKFTTNADGTDAVIQMTELVGEVDGPTIGISAAIHGNENTGSQVILELFRLLRDMPLKGRILLLPVANPTALAVNARFSPIDQVDLNRQFPGSLTGTYSQQLAAALTREFFDVIDVSIDLHSGTDRPTVDYVYINNAEDLSRAFGAKVLYRPVVDKQGTVFAGTTKAVTIEKRGIPSVVVELGGGIVDQTPYVTRTVDGVMNMLRHLGTIAGDVRPNPKQVVVNEIQGIRATTGGWIEPLSPANGEEIAGGAPLFRIIHPYTFEVLDEVTAPFTRGIMIMQHLTRNLVHSGDYGWMVGNLDGATD